MTHVTCRLTAKNRDQLQNPMLGNRVWATFTFFTWACPDLPTVDFSTDSLGHNAASGYCSIVLSLTRRPVMSVSEAHSSRLLVQTLRSTHHVHGNRLSVHWLQLDKHSRHRNVIQTVEAPRWYPIKHLRQLDLRHTAGLNGDVAITRLVHHTLQCWLSNLFVMSNALMLKSPFWLVPCPPYGFLCTSPAFSITPASVCWWKHWRYTVT